jgi:hypothetical protein
MLHSLRHRTLRAGIPVALAVSLAVLGAPAPAAASVSLDCAIEAGSPGSNATTDVVGGASQDPFLVTHPVFGQVTYFAHGNGTNKSTGVDIVFPTPVTAFLVSIVHNDDAPGSEYEEYAITGKDANATPTTVFNAVVRKLNGDFVFRDDGATTVTPLNGPSYAVPGANSGVPASLPVATPLAPGKAVKSLEIRWTTDTTSSARSAVLVVIGEQGTGLCTKVSGVSGPVVQNPTPPQPAAVVPAPPELVCDPSPVRPGAQVVCQVTGGPEDFDVLWNASLGGGAFAGQGVRLDASGGGTFAFVVPASAPGQEVTVELVAWLAPVSLGVVGGAVPASIPAGSGSTVPVGLVLFGLLVVAGSGVAVRRMAQAG